jgi:hypothetical protein
MAMAVRWRWEVATMAMIPHQAHVTLPQPTPVAAPQQTEVAARPGEVRAVCQASRSLTVELVALRVCWLPGVNCLLAVAAITLGVPCNTCPCFSASRPPPPGRRKGS